MTTFTCDKCSNKFNSHKILLEYYITCKKRLNIIHTKQNQMLNLLKVFTTNIDFSIIDIL